jgi:hypothetical protein
VLFGLLRLFSATIGGAGRANKYSHRGVRCFPVAVGFHPPKAMRRAKSTSAARSPTRASPIFARGPYRFAAARPRAGDVGNNLTLESLSRVGRDPVHEAAAMAEHAKLV